MSAQAISGHTAPLAFLVGVQMSFGKSVPIIPVIKQETQPVNALRAQNGYELHHNE